jgi:serine/threonine protein kinase/tetratricopeptide (TPR) repeat protein
VDEESIFAAALGKASPAERRAFLAEACAGDAELRACVEALLLAHDNPDSFLEPRNAGLAPTLDEQPIRERPGTVIGPYKLMEQIGEGGMGLVFVAEQQHPIRRRVAVKVLKPGMDTRQVVARFEAERQALALMDHPNIAKVLDGGETESGRPYFVMELVKGVPITQFCDDNRLTTRERLELFVPVCEAVQHAHQKGLIHRDLKPSNVLVASHDGKPVVQVIDFGVAKAVGQQLTDKTVYTQFAQMVGTPLYMSPEQAGLSSLDIDTRSDIYSLGVLLYELLTGTTPFDKERLHTVGYDELRRIIREEEPPRPSTRLSTLAQAAATVSANRQSDPKKLSRLIRGELDWIVMKCLEKDRNRRYESASGLAADVQRFLHDEPVQACPPSTTYRFRKFARRNRRALLTLTLLGATLLTTVLGLAIGLVAVNRERDRTRTALDAEAKRRQQARAALDALSSQVIRDWLGKQPRLLPVHKKFLESALKSYEEFAAETGEGEEARAGVAGAYQRVGLIRTLLGQLVEAGAALEHSRELFAALAADFPAVPQYRQDQAFVAARLSEVQMRTGQIARAEESLREALALQERLAAEFPDMPAYRADLAATHSRHGLLLKRTDRSPEAEQAYRSAIALQEPLAAEHPDVPAFSQHLAHTHNNLGILLEDTGRLAEAEQAYRPAAAIQARLVAAFPDDPAYRIDLGRSLNNLGLLLKKLGRLKDAEAAYDQALALHTQLAADFPTVPDYRQHVAQTCNNRATLLRDTGRTKEAEEAYRRALAIHRQLAAEFPAAVDHQNEVAGAMVNLARLLYLGNAPVEARRLLEEALPYHQAALRANPRHPTYRSFYRNNRQRLAETLLVLKDHAAAAAAAEEFLAAATKPQQDAFQTACLLAGCARLARQDPSRDEAARGELAEAYAGRAVAALRAAVRNGFHDSEKLQKADELEPLRARADFQKLLAEVESQKKSEPVQGPGPDKSGR